MQTAKLELKEIMARLPENCTIEDIRYHLYVLQKIECGMTDAKEGWLYSQEEIEETWLLL